jgi:hypothetical protein
MYICMYVCTMLHFEKQSTVANRTQQTHVVLSRSQRPTKNCSQHTIFLRAQHFTTLPTVIQIVTRHKAIQISLNDLLTIFLRMVTVPALRFVLKFIQ